MARLLTSANLMCGHESIFTPGGLEVALRKLSGEPVTSSDCSLVEEWFNPDVQVAESSYMAAPFLDHECLSNSRIIHVVRNPIKVISSTLLDADFFKADGQIPYRQLVYKHLPELEQIKDEVERIAAYYVWWNQMVEKKATRSYFRFNVEKIHTPELFDFLGVPEPSNPFNDTKCNSWKKDRGCDLTLADIPAGEIKDQFVTLAREYGYEI